jgi:hypothetical protein
MDFSTKLAQTRVYTTTNQNGVDSQEVYNEAILQALDGISPTGANTNSVTAQVVTGSGNTVGGILSASFITDASFVGTIAGATISASTTINITAENGATLQPIAYTVTAGSMIVLILNKP